MRLLKKKTVFLQSADAATGTSGNFSIDLPSESTFDEDHLFKVYISRIHLRNSFLCNQCKLTLLLVCAACVHCDA